MSFCSSPMRVACASLSPSPLSSFYGGLVITGCAVMSVTLNVVTIQSCFLLPLLHIIHLNYRDYYKNLDSTMPPDEFASFKKGFLLGRPPDSRPQRSTEPART